MLEVPEDRCERNRLFERIDGAFKAGDFEALGRALGGSRRWFDEPMPFELGLGHPLEYAIYWSPLAFIEKLIVEGADPNFADDAGFPAIIAALSSSRSDRLDVVALLIGRGADVDRRGLNDWTPLHYATCLRDIEAVERLLSAGADPFLRTRIDDCTTALEEAEDAGYEEGAARLRAATQTCARGAGLPGDV
ncbi:ankyrin repeat domain-containing protein [Mesorhizobium sp. CC13]|uniref:ankyrin repeat domain-containing protein n=1 Tax=Mesorhizobium sp. CC13 TaxID=3029194 RepID=UPI003265C9FB